MTVERFNGFRYTCDACGEQHIQENAVQQYPDGMPQGWGKVKVSHQLETKYIGKVWLLCTECTSKIVAAIDEGIKHD